MRRALGAVAILAVGVATAMQTGSAATSPDPGPAAAPAAAPACAPGTTRQTTNGPVCGIVAKNAAEWLGIPYAAPPVGDLRWASPRPPAPWTDTLPTTAF